MKIHLSNVPKAYTIIFVTAVIFPLFSSVCSNFEKTLCESVLMKDIKNDLSSNPYSQKPVAFLNSSKN